MAFIDLFGPGNQGFAWVDDYGSFDAINLEFTFAESDYLEVSADLVYEDAIRTGYEYYVGEFNFDANGFPVTGTINEIGTGSDDEYFTAYIENINISLDELFAVVDKETSRQLEAKLLSGDDFLSGSQDGGSIKARMLGGNDFVELFGGDDSDVNGNLGADTFQLFGGGGRIYGGKDNDTIDLYDGFYEFVNGNNGNDLLTNYSEFGNNIRGGKDDDLLVNVNGTAGSGQPFCIQHFV